MKKPKITNSNKLFKKAIKIIPGGSQTFSKGPSQFTNNFAPKYLKKGKGCNVWDVDNNKFIDYVMACQPLILGYSDPDINRAVSNQLKIGSTFSLMNKLEIEVAELLVKHIPSAEMVRFGKNGSDATSAAVRIARAYTKKDVVAVCGYHGWQDWYISSTTRNKGVPKEVGNLTKKFNYNDIDSLKKVFKENKDNIACVILEPMNVAYPEDNFLEKVKEITHQNNALLIFDEMITGFRFALGGASEYFGVTPDLATFGKAMANGYPISAICGKKEYMRMFEDVFFSSTFGGELTSIAASIATITKIQKHNIIENLTDKGKKIIKGVQEIIDKYDLQNYFSITGHPSWSFLNFKPNNTYSDYDIKTLFLQEIFQNGIITLGTHNLMLAHSDNDIDNLLLAYAKLLPKIADIVKNKEVDKYLKCHPLIPLFKIR